MGPTAGERELAQPTRVAAAPGVDPRSRPSSRSAPLGLTPDSDRARLYDRLIEAPRSRHDSRRTEESYSHWIDRFIAFHRPRHPAEMAEPEHLRGVKAIHEKGLAAGWGRVLLPEAPDRKYVNAPTGCVSGGIRPSCANE